MFHLNGSIRFCFAILLLAVALAACQEKGDLEHGLGERETEGNGEVQDKGDDPKENLAPRVQAGTDRWTYPGESLTLQGEIEDDGFPVEGSLTIGWKLVDGPGTASFSAPDAARTEVVFDEPGRYLLRLVASDGALSSHDDLEVTVLPEESRLQWHVPKLLGTWAGIGKTPFGAAVDVNAEGEALAVWIQSGLVRAARYYTDKGWQGEASLGKGAAEPPRVMLGNKGEALVAWIRTREQGGGIRTMRRLPGGGWQEGGVTPAVADVPLRNLRIVPVGSAEPVMIWIQGEAIWGSRGDGVPVPIDDGDATVVALEVIGDEDGNGTAVWVRRNASGGVWLQASGYRKDTGWEEAVTLWKGAGEVTKPRIGLGSGGDILVVWKGFGEGGSDSVWAVRRPSAGSGWEEAVSLAEAEGVVAVGVSAVRGAGFQVFWASGSNVWSRSWRAGGEWENARSVIDGRAGMESLRLVASGTDGVLLVWQEREVLWAVHDEGEKNPAPVSVAGVSQGSSWDLAGGGGESAFLVWSTLHTEEERWSVRAARFAPKGDGEPSHRPVAMDDTISSRKGNDISFDVLANDWIFDGVGSLRIERSPAYGTAWVDENKNIVYRRRKGTGEADYFTYLVIDGDGEQAVAGVTIPASPEEEEPDAGFDIDEALRLVNSLRAKGRECGEYGRFPAAPPLRWSETLAAIARAHSADMERNNHFSHTGSDGSGLGDRFKRGGYRYSYAGENIAYGMDSVERAIRGWIESPGHCANIMNARFTEIGIGRSGTYWTMNLGAPR